MPALPCLPRPGPMPSRHSPALVLMQAEMAGLAGRASLHMQPCRPSHTTQGTLSARPPSRTTCRPTSHPHTPTHLPCIPTQTCTASLS
eukprot:359310-Chlamydomonas_euryale.AAC.1